MAPRWAAKSRRPRRGRSLSARRTSPSFAARLIRWQAVHGRHDLPWQASRDPYRLWVAEIMLQQTQVATVIPYYQRFLTRFPDLESLARASEEEVLACWSGLGYYARARNLHRAAQIALARHCGRFPSERALLERLPGIGRSTAAAIAVFAAGAREAILDGNAKRVLARHFALAGRPGDTRFEARLWRLAESLLPRRGIERYTQALMDLGATICTRVRPACDRCPLRSSCLARQRDRVNAYPQPRRRAPRPLVRATMLVIVNAGEVLVEKRGPTGVWAGLWCPPQLPRGEKPADFCRRRFGVALARTHRLAAFEHGFTHFRLRITPLVCRAASVAARAAAPGALWLPLVEAGEAALPAPVKKLLLALAAGALRR